MSDAAGRTGGGIRSIHIVDWNVEKSRSLAVSFAAEDSSISTI